MLVRAKTRPESDTRRQSARRHDGAAEAVDDAALVWSRPPLWLDPAPENELALNVASVFFFLLLSLSLSLSRFSEKRPGSSLRSSHYRSDVNNSPRFTSGEGALLFFFRSCFHATRTFTRAQAPHPVFYKCFCDCE